MSTIPLSTLGFIAEHPEIVPNLMNKNQSGLSGLIQGLFTTLVVLGLLALGAYFIWAKFIQPKPLPPMTSVDTAKSETPLKAQFYIDCDFKGTMAELGVGDYDMNSMVIGNDMLSSVKVPSGLKVTLFGDAGFKGPTKILTSDSSCLSDFNDKTSSIRIEKV